MLQVKLWKDVLMKRLTEKSGKIVHTVKDRLQNAILTGVNSNIGPEIEYATKSINAAFGRDASSVTAISERGEDVGITALFENASINNIILHKSNLNDKTRKNIPDEVTELSVQGTRFKRQ